MAQEGPYSAGVARPRRRDSALCKFLQQQACLQPVRTAVSIKASVSTAAAAAGGDEGRSNAQWLPAQLVSPRSPQMCAATSDVTVLHYFPARGRAEPIRWAGGSCTLHNRARHRPDAAQPHQLMPF